ncbi:VWA domain-containing protein [Woeseiaceae bacterium]|nr:VWA domain-containing protein [Woeseiaceae bacterium]
MWADFHWLRPEWFWVLPLSALITFAMARRELAPGNWQRIIDSTLAPYVLLRSVSGKHNYRWWLMILGGIIATLSLAGPSWNRAEKPVFRSEQAMVIAIDLSRSMDAQDLTPSRLSRAKLKILDILERRNSGQTALIVYSANAFTVTPLTTDSDTVAALVNSLDTNIMPSRGSYPVAAINKGRQLLEQAGIGYGEVLLITDGGTSPAAERAAANLYNGGYTLSVMGVGTLAGAPVPKVGGGFVTDQSGQIAVSKLESKELQRLATAGNGRYMSLSVDDRDLDVLLSGVIDFASTSNESLATDQWQEEGPWLLLFLLPLASLAFRRGWVLVIFFVLMPVIEPVYAFSWDDLWLTKDQQAQKQLAEGNAVYASQLFKDPVWKAVANYRAQEYAGSAEGFAGQEDTKSLYNLGNALARLGKFESAIHAYDQVLGISPNNEDARYNRDVLKELLDQQQQSESDQNQKSSSQSSGGTQQSESDDNQDQSGTTETEEDAGAESETSNSSRNLDEMNQDDLEAIQEELERAAQQEAQQGGDKDLEDMRSVDELVERRAQEQRHAMEQWLRRIPNDPGGLLRRKFRYQYQRMGRDQDGNNLWPDDEVQPW